MLKNQNQTSKNIIFFDSHTELLPAFLCWIRNQYNLLEQYFNESNSSCYINLYYTNFLRQDKSINIDLISWSQNLLTLIDLLKIKCPKIITVVSIEFSQKRNARKCYVKITIHTYPFVSSLLTSKEGGKWRNKKKKKNREEKARDIEFSAWHFYHGRSVCRL